MKTLVKYRLAIFSLCSLIFLTALADSTAFADYQAAYAAYRNGNFTETLRQLEPLDQQGNPHAQYLLGEIYRDGQGVPRNLDTAASWYRRAAKQGDESAQLALAQMYERGEGVQQNYAKAAYWYQWAAEHEVAEAQFRLGQYYISGLGVEKNEEKAAMWYQLAARQGHEQAVEDFAQPSTFDEVALEEVYNRWKQASPARLAALLDRQKEADDSELQGEISPPKHSNWPIGLLGFLAVLLVLWLLMSDLVFSPPPFQQLSKRLKKEPEQRPSDPPLPSSGETTALDVEGYRRQRLQEDLKDLQRSNEPEDQERQEFDRKWNSLHSLKELYEAKKMVSICYIGGMLLLVLSVFALTLPFDEAHPWNSSSWNVPLKLHLFFLWLGLPLFLYGWLWTRKILAVGKKQDLLDLARMLKRAELDKKLTVTTELNSSNELIFHVHDKKEGLEQGVWVRNIGVTEQGEFYSSFCDSGIKWRSKHG
jgi:hypothetical protein